MPWRTLIVRFAIPALLLLIPVQASAQSPSSTSSDDDVVYVLPSWIRFHNSNKEQVAEQFTQLRQRIGEGPFVRVGFTIPVYVSMTRWDVDPADRAEVRSALAGTIAAIDALIARARSVGVPICLSVQLASRDSSDPAETASGLEDRRNMQWYSDNVLANNWWTHSRYARKQSRLQEAYLRELGRVIANRMALYPDIVVAATGDGEVELSYGRAPAGADPVLADYSPFAVAEFRDWLRHGGLYAQDQPFQGEGYELGSRYAGDASPAEDTNGDGHTLNGDFGTMFTTWRLRYFDWDLADAVNGDPHAIPIETYGTPRWNALPSGSETGFDAPRYRLPSDAWLKAWRLFRETMIWRNNLRFAKWMTTSVDEATGARIPASRWYSNQIPADYLFGLNPDHPHPRLETSASPWWTADVSPYGSLGITAFSINFGGVVMRTLPAVAPKIAQRNVRWGLIEWGPCLSASPSIPQTLDVCRPELDLVVQYRPSLIVPFAWASSDFPIEGTPFETALRELVNRLNAGRQPNPQLEIELPAREATLSGEFTVAGWAVDLGNRGANRGTGIDAVHVYAYPEAPGQAAVFLGQATYGLERPDVSSQHGLQFARSGFSLAAAALPHGRYRVVTYARTTLTDTFSITKQVNVTVPRPQSDPLIALEGPSDNSTTVRDVTVVGWAIDRGTPSGTGVDTVHVWAYPTNGAAGQFVGVTTYGLLRSDVASHFGERFARSGYRLDASLTPGTYRIVAFAHSTLEGAFNASASAVVTVAGKQPNPVMSLDGPQSNSTVGRTVTVAGWAIDRGASSGTGVDTVHVWAYPNDGGVAQFLDVATYGLARPDIAAVFGSQFTNSGYRLSAVVSPPGKYRIVAFARSTVTGTFSAAVGASNVTVQDTNSNAVLFVDTPATNTAPTRPFTVSGWAVDSGSDSGTGIDAIHVWAFPTSGAPATFVGVATYGTSRLDIGALFGDARFNDSGFTFTVTNSSLAADTYDLIVFGRSTVTNGFTVARVVRVTVQ